MKENQTTEETGFVGEAMIVAFMFKTQVQLLTEYNAPRWYSFMALCTEWVREVANKAKNPAAEKDYLLANQKGIWSALMMVYKDYAFNQFRVKTNLERGNMQLKYVYASLIFSRAVARCNMLCGKWGNTNDVTDFAAEVDRLMEQDVMPIFNAVYLPTNTLLEL